MKELKIKVHSIVDLITNSSTEIYVYAGDYTLKSVKELIDSLLEIGGSIKKADDLFTFELSEENDSTRSLIVKAINEDELTIKVAKTLSNLTDMFDIDAYYNG